MSKPKYVEKALVDGDIVAYRSAFATKDKTAQDCYDAVDDLMEYILSETTSFYTEDSFKTYLTGRDNFRYSVAKTYHYKGNRKNVEKPVWLPAAREYLEDTWNAVVSSGCEADDLIAMEAMKGDPKANVICSIDKDFKTVPTWMFNFVKGTWEYSTEEDAMKFFYTQVLTGDSADNIVGLHRVGPKTAEKILDGFETEEELFEACLKAYKEDKNLVGDPYERLIENAQLLHLQRYSEEVWEPPK